MPAVQQMMPRWAKRRARKLLKSGLKYRQRTWQNRALPDFIIIGAQKAGTTSLFSYLRQHPQLLPSCVKEIHFFDGGLNPNIDNFGKGQAWYRAHFPLRKNLGADQKTFEASPLYIFNPLAPRRIFELIPEVKIIALLRNPTERAISDYFHERRGNRESLPIYEALQQEDKRLESVINSKDFKNSVFIRHSYKSRGLYKEQLERYLGFFPRQRILLLGSEKFFADPNEALRRVFEFVEVEPEFKVKNLKPRNVSNASRSEVAADVYEYLDSYFLPHNQALYELVGENYGW